MNAYLILILSLIIGMDALETVSDLLNLNRLKDHLTEEFQEIYDSKKYSESLKYQKEKLSFEWISRTVSLIALVTFILMASGWI